MHAGIEVRDLRPKDEYFVGTCSHRNESEEIDACARRRVGWLKEHHGRGVRVKVALRDERHAGFLFCMPIEVSPWGPRGTNLLVVPCLYVLPHSTHQGVGGALLESAEQEARDQGLGGIVLQAIDLEGWWFMPAAYFAARDWREAERRGATRLLWKPYEAGVEAPRLLEPAYTFRPVAGRVVVDLFWNRFCLTSDMEAQRVREVVAEFGDHAVLNEHAADEAGTLDRYGITRALYVDGQEISWGYEAPRDGIRDAIRAALHDHR